MAEVDRPDRKGAMGLVTGQSSIDTPAYLLSLPLPPMPIGLLGRAVLVRKELEVSGTRFP